MTIFIEGDSWQEFQITDDPVALLTVYPTLISKCVIF